MRCWLPILTCLVACGTDTAVPDPQSWYGDVGPLVITKCSGCHHAGGIAPFSLREVGEAQEHITDMLQAIDTGLMPPFSADDAPDCVPRHAWRDDVRLTARERELLHDWMALGMPVGSPRKLPEPPSTTLDDPTITVAPVQPFTASGDRDQFVCFLFDPQIASAAWLVSAQVVPTAPTLVHHANVYLVDPGDAAAAMTAIGGIGVPKLGCDNPPGAAIMSWLPGNPALVLPGDVGIHVSRGTLIAIQVHYHPAGGGGPDASSVQVKLTDSAPGWSYTLGVYGNATGAPRLLPDPDDPPSGPQFVIPANKPDHVEAMAIPHSAAAPTYRVISVTPHMHMLGTHERATITHHEGDTECLIDSGWSFDWQRTYFYAGAIDELPLFDPSSTVNVSCHWDNTFANPNLPRLLHDVNAVAPFDVQLGLTTTDEMCLADFGLVSEN